MSFDYVSEIYSSIQGEGPYTGERHVFLRLAGCPLRCDYCDTPGSLTATGHARLGVTEVLEQVNRLCESEKIKTVSVTGGEPLAHGLFLKELLPLIKVQGYRVYLETAGVHPEVLEEVEPFVDIVAMDIKLPSAVGREYWAEHKEFLRIGKNKIFVKIVLEPHTPPAELEKACCLLSEQEPIPQLILQPVTPQLPKVKALSADQVADFYQLATSLLPRVLVMPQHHKLWKAR